MKVNADNAMLHILLADDNEGDRFNFKEALKEIKVRTNISLVENGKQLMEYLNQTEKGLPDVVFFDINKSVIGGMDCLIEIRKNIRLRDLSIVIYSASASDEEIEKALVKGANIYVNKSNDLAELKSNLNHVINLNWQYYTLGLKKEYFLLNINSMKKNEA